MTMVPFACCQCRHQQHQQLARRLRQELRQLARPRVREAQVPRPVALVSLVQALFQLVPKLPKNEQKLTENQNIFQISSKNYEKK